MAADASKPALQIVGQYDLIEKVAEGGMGTVYRGRNRRTGETVAVKLVSPQVANNVVFLQRFEKEYNAARNLNHPNIVRALDYGTSSGRPFLVMEFIQGESIGQRIERLGRLPEDEALRLIGKAAQGLEQAHKQGLIHRDIKPDNIMVTVDGQVKIADLGLVKEVEAEVNLTRTGRGLGTPHFMAPEQFRNAKHADVRCDVYSLAATLYMMLTGKMPFHSSGPLDAFMKKVQNDLTPARKLNPAVSEQCERAIRRAMDADPEQRPASCSEFVADLMGQGTAKPPTARTEAPPPDFWYLVYKDEEGTRHTVKGSISGIRRSLRDGLLGDTSIIRVCRTKAGPFQPLYNLNEFRDLVGDQTPATGRGATPSKAQLARTSPDGMPEDVRGPEAKAEATKGSTRGFPYIPWDTNGAPRMELIKLLLLLAVAMGVGVLAGVLFLR
jgi:serine/threonine protein kinase